MSNGEVAPLVNGWVFGLKGVMGSIGNVSAMGIIVYCFLSGQADMKETARADREVFRAALQQLHDDNNKLAASVDRLADSLRK